MSYFKSRPFCFAFAIGFAAGVVFVSVGAAILIPDHGWIELACGKVVFVSVGAAILILCFGR